MFLLFMIFTAVAIALLPMLIGLIRKHRIPGRRIARKVVIAVIGELSLVCLGIISYTIGMREQNQFVAWMRSGENMRFISKALFLYMQDWDGTFPPGGKWEDAISNPKYFGTPDFQKYLKCPVANSYAFNEAVAGQKYSAISRPGATILLFESKIVSRNATGSVNDLAPATHESPNITLCDGRVTWTNQTILKTFSWSIH